TGTPTLGTMAAEPVANYARVNAAQTLTAAQKTQGLTNLGCTALGISISQAASATALWQTVLGAAAVGGQAGYAKLP
ncbi:hypothetical protein V5F44_21430, partial [Xanthobacter sp. V2C-8]